MASNFQEAKYWLSGNEIDAMPEAHIRHPWNPKSDVYLKRLSAIAGLSRLSLSIARVPPGKESFLYHRHERDEEFIFILAGRGRAEIGDETLDVGPGDFMGFPAPGGPAHHLINSHDEDLVYLMGGESSGLDVGVFPKEGRRLVFSPSGIFAMTDEACEQLTFDDFIVD